MDDSIRRVAEASLAESARVSAQLPEACLDSLVRSAKALVDCFSRGGKVLLFGNGGSAADAQHIAAELVGRFEVDRRPLPAVALTTDTSALSAIANDYGFEDVFSRQVAALGSPADIVIAISTSGQSNNVAAGVRAARDRGLTVIALTGQGGESLAKLADVAVVIPSRRTSRIQEAHIVIGHVWCELVEQLLFGAQRNR